MKKVYQLDEFFNYSHNISLEGLAETSEDYSTYHWSGFDNADNFNINYKKYKKYLHKYIDRPIEYHINKLGFRSKYDFDKLKDTEVDIALGCSMTFGLGMYEEFTWPSVLGKELDRQILNLGVTGGGVDISYVNLSKVIDRLNIKNVFQFNPVYARYYGFDPYTKKHFTVHPGWNNKEGIKVYTEDYTKAVLINDDFITFNHKRATDAVSGLCASKGINYFLIDIDLINFHFITNYDSLGKKVSPYPSIVANNYPVAKGDILSRELIHPSKYSYREIAMSFVDKVRTKRLV